MIGVPPEWRGARRVVAAASVLFLLVVCRWQPWTLFQQAGFSNDFYDEQARAFWRLRLDVPAEAAGPEGFLIDGRTYLYFGPFLALLRMPFVLVGDWFDERLVRLSMTAAYALSCIGALRLLRAVAERARAEVSPRRAAWFVALVAAGPTVSAAGWDSVYHETELWALALFLLALAAVLDLAAAPSPRLAARCGILTVATVLTRASIGYGAVVALGLVALAVFRSRRATSLVIATWSVGALATSLALNLAKFGTLLDLPADRQLLTLQSPARAAWFDGNGGSFFSVRFLPTTLVQYLRPDAVRGDRLVPFVRFGPLATEYGSYPLEGNTPSSSLPVTAGALVVLAALGVWWVIRGRRTWAAPVLAGALVAAVPTLLIGFVAQRYLLDLLPAVLVPAAVAVAYASAMTPRRQVVGRVVLPLAVAWSLVANVAFATWISELKNPAFTSLRYAIDGAIFGDPPPGVIRLGDTSTVPRDGIVAIDGACAGLYIAEQGSWVPLERADGVRSLRLRVRPSDRPVTIATGQGDIVVALRDGTLAATWQPAGGPPVVGSAPGFSDVADIHIVSDPVVGGLRLTSGDTALLTAMAAPDLVTAVLDGAVEVEERAGSTTTCDTLLRRLAADG